MARPFSTLQVLSVPVACATIPDVVDQIDEWIEHNQARTICVTGMHGIMESYRNPEILAAHTSADLVVPDGMPLVWFGRALGDPTIDRVYGPDLTAAVCERAQETGWSMHFIGGTVEAGARCLATLAERYPALRVTGHTSPPFRVLTPEEDEALVEELRRIKPEILWVCLGSPKQERWMRDHRDRLPGIVQVGTGAALDFLAGTVSQAPRWIQRSCLEWLYRLVQEPRRLWRRYILNIPQFLWLNLRYRPTLSAPADR